MKKTSEIIHIIYQANSLAFARLNPEGGAFKILSLEAGHLPTPETKTQKIGHPCGFGVRCGRKRKCNVFLLFISFPVDHIIIIILVRLLIFNLNNN